jgi:hypothetical protein
MQEIRGSNSCIRGTRCGLNGIGARGVWMTWLFILVCINISSSYCGYALKIPPSFQSNQKLASSLMSPHTARTSAGDTMYRSSSPPIKDIVKLLSSFEIDNHFEIVLVGPSFDPKCVDDLSNALELLSTISVELSPSEYVHEKMVYHVSLGATIVDEISDRISAAAAADGIVDVESMAQILHDFHFRGSTMSTLFLLYFPVAAAEGYRYSSPLSYCRKQSFISSDGFAWLDISAESFTILPLADSTDILPQLDCVARRHWRTPGLNSDKGNSTPGLTIDNLAADIFRSVEAISPYPVTSADPTKLASISTSKVFGIVIVTICSEVRVNKDGVRLSGDNIAEGPSGQSCEADPVTLSIVRQLLNDYSSQFVTIRIAEMQSDVSVPSVAHALNSAGYYYPPRNSKSPIIIDTDELLYWLSASKDIQDGFAEVLQSFHSSSNQKFSEDDVTLLPIFVLRFPEQKNVFSDQYMFPDDRNIVLDEHFSLVGKGLPQPAGGWYIPSLDESEVDVVKYVRSASWPRNAIISLSPVPRRGVQVAAPPRDREIEKMSVAVDALSCRQDSTGTAKVLPNMKASFNHDELFHTMRSLLWGIDPPYRYYSSSAQKIVYDYVWYAPDPLTDDWLETTKYLQSKLVINSNRLSFRERRALFRLIAFTKAETTLHRFATTLSEAYALVPPVNITELLDFHWESVPKSPSKTVSKNKDTALSAVFGNSKRDQASSSTRKNYDRNEGIFEQFLTHMDTASSSIAHQRFDKAIVSLQNALQVATVLERKIRRIITLRVGTVTCSDTDIPRTEEVVKGTAAAKVKRSLFAPIWNFIFGELRNPDGSSVGNAKFATNAAALTAWSIFLCLCVVLGIGLGVYVSVLK